MDAYVNGIDIAAVARMSAVAGSPGTNPKARFGVKTAWDGQTRTVATVDGYSLGDEYYKRSFTIVGDEPTELGGRDTGPNPVELLMAGLNSCISVTYVTVAAMKGISIRSLQIETSGELDIRGFLGIDESINPGFDEVQYTILIDADGTPEEIEDIHQTVLKRSVNLANLSKAVRMVPTLVVAHN
ncbi:putative OsmC-like protein [Paraburkholderia sp. BL6669N2]|uniref:OsmC family protein n=1 Tax=Paraburkholderia sp. BL6669N2 TaxID=1938807 RepID=UPI000E28997E|nr:OsmC family protein [Paraburkholderia sp. BL6669N2]REG45510.1 putative OsmC-like protein [Paraburkholderia sp. BL6669N2]